MKWFPLKKMHAFNVSNTSFSPPKPPRTSLPLDAPGPPGEEPQQNPAAARAHRHGHALRAAQGEAEVLLFGTRGDARWTRARRSRMHLAAGAEWLSVLTFPRWLSSLAPPRRLCAARATLKVRRYQRRQPFISKTAKQIWKGPICTCVAPVWIFRFMLFYEKNVLSEYIKMNNASPLKREQQSVVCLWSSTRTQLCVLNEGQGRQTDWGLRNNQDLFFFSLFFYKICINLYVFNIHNVFLTWWLARMLFLVETRRSKKKFNEALTLIQGQQERDGRGLLLMLALA